MGSTWEEVLAKLRSIPRYVSDFQAAYADGIQKKNIQDAIAEYERSLYTPNSRFDRYLRGETAIISTQEKAGYGKFKGLGCVSCHQGVNLGGNMFETFGTMADYFAGRGELKKVDMGRFNVTGKAADKHVFKVPTLRNIALTAPYFHDGSAESLEEAVRVMAKFQLGRTLSAADVEDIVAFLKTLTGEYQGKPL